MLGLEWELEMLARLLLALILGTIIGMERESANKFAGFRTHVLVAVGSCLMMIISISMPFIPYPGHYYPGISTGDPGRIAAQVVSGIGFLGAGAIMSSGISIKGLTTAASLWAMAGLGLACGAGLYVSAVFCTVLIFIALSYFSKLEEKVMAKKQLFTLVVLFEQDSSQMWEIFSIFNQVGISIRNTKVYEDAEGLMMELVLKKPIHVDMPSLIEHLRIIPTILRVEMLH